MELISRLLELISHFSVHQTIYGLIGVLYLLLAFHGK